MLASFLISQPYGGNSMRLVLAEEFFRLQLWEMERIQILGLIGKPVSNRSKTLLLHRPSHPKKLK